jgi:hypothetical protein
MPQANIKLLHGEFVNPFTRMLPLKGTQYDVYRMGEKSPPGLEGYQPRWEVVNAVILALQTIQVRIDIMSDFHLMALLASSTSNLQGGFRMHLYDQLKQQRIGGDRGLQFPNIGGNSAAPFFLSEPYRFDLPKSQMLVQLQNMEDATNTVQLAVYGVAAPFTGRLSNEF